MMLKLLVGIGNPGIKYSYTRHNIGWEFIDKFNSNFDFQVVKNTSEYELWKGDYNNTELYTMKPLTFVNNSGLPLKKVLKKLNITSDKILIFVDDINLQLGEIRLKKQGSSGGHNGLKSIFNQLQTQNIPRLRLGIGVKDIYNHDLISFVLGKFKNNELIYVDRMIEESIFALDDIFNKGFEKTMELQTGKKNKYMGSIDKNLINQLSGLVKLNLTKNEIDILLSDLNDILNSFSKLNSINTSEFDEFDNTLKDNNQTREDKYNTSWDKQIILENAPNHNGDELYIEQVLGEE